MNPNLNLEINMHDLVPITERALTQRINRALKARGEALRTTRGSRGLSDLGEHHILDLNTGFVLDKHLDLEAYGRELGVLRPHEHVIRAA